MIEAVGYGVLLPACVAAGVTWLIPRLLRGTAGRRLGVTGLACGFLAGYGLASDGEWSPERNWHWLPYLAMAASAVGAAAAAGASIEHRRSRSLAIAVPILFLILSATASLSLVPDWTDRRVQVPAFAALLLALLLLYDPLPRHVASGRFVLLLSLCAFTTAACLAARISLSYARLAGLAAAAFAGSSLVFWMRKDPIGIRGLLPAYVVLLEGAAYVGCIYPQEPIYGLLLPPAAPLVLWTFSRGPLSRVTGIRRAVCECGLVLLVLAGIAVLLIAGSAGDSASEW